MSIEATIVLQGEGAAEVPESLRSEGEAYGRGIAYAADYLNVLSSRLGLPDWYSYYADTDRVMDEIIRERGESETIEEEEALWEECARRLPYYPSDKALPHFSSVLEHLLADAEPCRAALYQAGGSYDEVVWDLRVIVETLKVAARKGQAFHLSVS